MRFLQIPSSISKAYTSLPDPFLGFVVRCLWRIWPDACESVDAGKGVTNDMIKYHSIDEFLYFNMDGHLPKLHYY